MLDTIYMQKAIKFPYFPNTNYLLEEMNAIDVKDKINEKTIAMLVLGACENHGDHMPFGSDFIFPVKLVENIIKDLINSKEGLHDLDSNIILLPAIPYGVSSHHNTFQMTLSLEPITLISIIENIISSLYRNGIRRVIVINGHDGNIGPIEIASRNIKDKFPEMVIACLESWWVLVGQKNKGLFEVWDGLGHGGEAETSAMLYVRPDLVDIKLAPIQTIPNLPSQEVRIYWKFNELTNTGSTGAPHKATKEKGKEIVEILKGILISYIKNMDNCNWKYGLERPNTDA
ncbi:MAG: creatininase family protein [Candidatus Nitrosocosmicus sp.]